MTVIRMELVTCAICGYTSEQRVLCSTMILGPPDLDTRPGEMAHSTIFAWIQTCPSCNYCAPDLSKQHPESASVVRGDPYRQQYDNPQLPALANAFLCHALIEDAAGEHGNAGWARVHAAWACDDKKKRVGAKKCREAAVISFQRAKEKGQAFAEQPGGEEAFMTDLLRRSGQFELADAMCDQGLKDENMDKQVREVLRYEKTLIRDRDARCHTMPHIEDTPKETREIAPAPQEPGPPAGATTSPLFAGVARIAARCVTRLKQLFSIGKR